MLENSFIPHLLATGLPIDTQRFMQDGAHLHTANVVLDFLYETFNLRVMSHWFPECHEGGKLWPPHSLDIYPCDFFLWGFLKGKVFQRRPEYVAQLGAHIVKLCHALSEDLCRKVVTNARVRFVCKRLWGKTVVTLNISSLGTIFQPMRINSVLDVKCFCNNKNVVWHFMRHPVLLLQTGEWCHTVSCKDQFSDACCFLHTLTICLKFYLRIPYRFFSQMFLV